MGALVEYFISRLIVLFYGTLAIFGIFLAFLRGPIKFCKRVERKTPPKVLKDHQYGLDKYAFLKKQGVKLHYVESGDAGKPLMLLVHGFPEFWYSWRYQIEEFRKDYRVVAIDNRGYNDSDKPSGWKHYKYELLCTDIKEIIEYLGYKSCVLVGHDWGGLIVFGVAQRYPELIDTLIVMNAPHGGAASDYVRSHISQLRKSWYIFFFQWPCLPELMMKANDFRAMYISLTGKKSHGASRIDADDLEAYKYVFGKPGCLTGGINYYRANLLRSRELREWMSKDIQCPTLIIWGTNDKVLERELADESIKFCTSKKSRVRYIEGASHFVQQDRPDDVNREMREFLTGL